MSESTLTKKPPVSHDWTKEDYGEYRKEMSRYSQRKRRAAAREKGYCVICASRPAQEGYATCQQCYARVRLWQKNHK